MRVLIVDDTALFRTAIKATISENGNFEVVGSARDGEDALKKIEELDPDIVTLDLEMPVLDGIGVLERLKNRPNSKQPKVIVFSKHSSEGADITMRALNLGAVDFAIKPNSSEGFAGIAKYLVPRLEGLLPSHLTGRLKKKNNNSFLSAPPVSIPRRVLAIASSTGGPKALAAALRDFPKTFPVPIVITQHMPAMFTKSFANSLNSQCQLTVHEAAANQHLQPGHVYIAPGNYHMEFKQGVGGTVLITLNQKDKIYGLRPAADIMFPSVDAVFGDNAIYAIFTGMGKDGTVGLENIRARHQLCLTQTKESCIVYGMPAAVDLAGLSHGNFTPETFYQTVSAQHLHW